LKFIYLNCLHIRKKVQAIKSRYRSEWRI